ncbi:MAG: arginase family protein [Bacteroidales bacterium]
MNLLDYLIPSYIYNSRKSDSFEKCIVTFSENIQLSDYDAFIISCDEDRLAGHTHDYSASAQKIRKQFNRLVLHEKNIKIVDFGEIICGKTYNDTRAAIQYVLSQLLQYNKPIIFVGGTHDLFVEICNEILAKEEYPSVSIIDSGINYAPQEEFTNTNFLSALTQQNPHIKITHLAHQSYLTSNDSIKWMNENYYPHYRLAELKNIYNVEQHIRDSHCISFDLSSIRYSDSPASIYSLPAGLSAMQSCDIAWQSGFSDKMNIFFVTEYIPNRDKEDVSALLSAQIIWHVLEGISQRQGELITDETKQYFSKYHVNNDYLNQDLIFYQSKKTQKMWLEMTSGFLYKRFIPCLIQEYEEALRNEIPHNFYLEFQRMLKNK